MKSRTLILALSFLLWSYSQIGICAKPGSFVQTGHTSYVSAIAFSPDGKYIISGGGDETTRLWDVATGVEIRTFKGHKMGPTAVAFSPDGRYVLTGGEFDKTLRLWDIASGDTIRIFKGHKDDVIAVAFDRDGKHLVSASKDKTIRIWDMATGMPSKVFQGSQKSVNAAAFSPDGKYAFMSGGFKVPIIDVWDVATGKRIQSLKGHERSIQSIAVTQDGRYALSSGGYNDRTIRLWDLKTGKRVRYFKKGLSKKLRWDANSVAFSPDGKTALSGGRDRSVLLWDVNTGKIVKEFKGDFEFINAVGFSPDGKYAAAGCDNSVFMWDTATGQLIKEFTGNVTKVGKVVLSPDGKVALIASLATHHLRNLNGKVFLTTRNGNIHLRDLTNGRQIRVFKGHSDRIDTLDFSPDGKYALSGSRDRSIRLWEIATGKMIQNFRGHKGALELVTFSLDGKQVLSMGDYKDRSIRLWDIATGEAIKTYEWDKKTKIKEAIFSPNKKFLLTLEDSREGINNYAHIRLRNVNTGEIKELSKINYKYSYPFLDVSVSRSGRYLAFGLSDHTIRLLDMSTGKTVRIFKGHKSSVHDVVISSNEKYILSASFDQTIRLWEMATGKQLKVYKGHTNYIISIAFTPDGKNILSSSGDGSVRFWSVVSVNELAKFYQFEKEQWVVITPEGYFNASPEGASHVNVRVRPLEVLKIDQFFEQFFNPAIVAKTLQGEKVHVEKKITEAFAPPPTVTVVSPESGQNFTQDAIQVTVLARDMGGGIDEIRLFHNGKAIGSDQRKIAVVTKIDTLKRTYQAVLVQGKNHFRAIAFSRDRTESIPYELVIQLQGPEKETSLNLLVVGINDYKNPALNLNYAKPDAKSIAAFFKSYGAKLFKNIYIHELYDTQATGASIRSKLADLSHTPPQDVVIIFLAGHGENVDGKWFFVPHEVTYPERVEQVRTQCVSSDEIADYTRDMGARKILLLMDSCKAGAALLAFRGYEDRLALMQLARATGVHIVAASTKNQYAAEVKTLGHGVFTHTLLTGIQGAAAAGDQKTITVRRLLAFVEEKLPEISKKFKQEAQYPVVYSRGMDFPLAVK